MPPDSSYSVLKTTVIKLRPSFVDLPPCHWAVELIPPLNSHVSQWWSPTAPRAPWGRRRAGTTPTSSEPLQRTSSTSRLYCTPTRTRTTPISSEPLLRTSSTSRLYCTLTRQGLFLFLQNNSGEQTIQVSPLYFNKSSATATSSEPLLRASSTSRLYCTLTRTRSNLISWNQGE